MERLFTFLCTLLILISYCFCNIHRTISGNNGNSIKSRVKLPATGFIDELDEESESTGIFDRFIEKANSAWLYAIPAAILVGSTGIFPLLIFTSGNCPSGKKLSEAISPAHLRLLLSFSVGGLFGDVFLHLLPEAVQYLDPNDHFAAQRMGLWMIGGLLCFFIIERIFSIHEQLNEEETAEKEDGEVESDKIMTNGEVCNGLNGYVNGVIHKKIEEKRHLNGYANGIANGHMNGIVAHGEENGYANGVIKRKKSIVADNDESSPTIDSTVAKPEHERELDNEKKIVGYLNLLANCIDNFTHGLAVGGSFIVSVPVGICTTVAILLHEIPHEIGDFAILLKAGFNRWEAAKGQVITASGALFGCLFGLLAEGAGDTSAWVLPFTSGGFIYIACVTVIPDLLKEENMGESIKQMVMLFAGIAIMGLAGLCH